MRILTAFCFLLMAVGNSFGATRIHKTVAPSDGDYTSLETCLNANEQDLVSNGSYLDVEITGSWSSADTTSVTLHNYTLDSDAAGDNYINIYTDDDNRAGTSFDTSKYRLVPPTGWGGNGLTIASGGKITVNGLQIAIQNNTNYMNAAISADAYSGDELLFVNCFFAAFNNTSVGPGINLWENPNLFNIKVRNTIIVGFSDGAYHNKYDGVISTTTFENVTVVGCTSRGIYNRADRGIFILKNVLSYDNATDFAIGNCGASSTNNLSSDDTAPAYGTYYRDAEISFTGEADFALASTDTDAIDHGVDLSSIFTTDINGTTRGATWDIGADEYVSAAPATTSGFIPYYKWFSR